jgi:hypothetical protein
MSSQPAISGASPNQPVKGDVQQTVVVKESPSSMAYIIALITIGAAFGNMFLAGKIRNVMRAEMPKAGQAASGYSNGPRQSAGAWRETAGAGAAQQNGQKQQQWKQRYEEQSRQQQQQQQTKFDREDFEFFDPRIDHLKKLGLTIEQNNEQAIKARFRELVLKYHPDRVSDEVLKEKNQQIFQDINNSYQSLMKYMMKK